jgi:hypothetical protein
MHWKLFGRFVGELFHPAKEKTDGLSRRDLLAGLGMLGAVAIAGPKLLAPGEAAAAVLDPAGLDPQSALLPEVNGPEPIEPAAAEGVPEVSEVSAQRRRRRRVRRRRYHWRQLARDCRNPGFRRRNPGLCRRVLGYGPPRRGACVVVGPALICN